MSVTTQIWVIGVSWIALLVFVTRLTMRSPAGSVGLPIAFLYSMSFLYCGFAAYAVPGYSHLRPDGSLYLQSYGFTEDTVLLGVQACLLGVASFAVGCWLGEPGRSSIPVRDRGRRDDKGRRSKILLALGLFGLTGFLLNGVSLPVPMAQALLQVARNTAIVVVCLGALYACSNGEGYLRWMAAAALIPSAYLVVWGVTSYGFIASTIIAGFWLCQLKPTRWNGLRLGLGISAASYLLLSLFVTWMSFRQQLRSVLWSQAGFGERLEALGTAISNTELLSPSNFASLDWLNGRLNQYIFVGKMIVWHDMMPDLRLYGKTLYLALIVWLPRFIWSDKPEMGGSSFVSLNTGMRLSQTSTFGAGPVFEFYVNFGYVGVVAGFIGLGLLLRKIDLLSAYSLRTGDTLKFVCWFVVGIAFIAPLTDFFFMFNGAVMSWLVISAFGLFIGIAPGRRVEVNNMQRLA